MRVFCTERFKTTFESLAKKNSYKEIEQDIVEYFFDKTIDQVNSGTVLNFGSPNPFIKKRIGGSGGYRIYFYVIIVKGNVYLSYIHPKAGSSGRANTETKERTVLMKETTEAIDSNNLYELAAKDKKLYFTKVK